MKLAFVDLETTGLDPRRHCITEVAAVTVEFEPGPQWRSTWSVVDKLELKVEVFDDVDPLVCRLNGFSPALWKAAAVSLSQAMRELYPYLEGALFCGSNPAFDLGFLRAAFEKLGWGFPAMASYHPLDVPSAAAHLLVTGKIEKLSQALACRAIGLPGREAHRAMADAMECMELFLALAQECRVEGRAT